MAGLLDDVRRGLAAAPPGFHLLLGAILVVLALSVLFALTAALLRYRNGRMATRWRALEGRWESLLMEVLAGDAPRRALWERVRPGEEMYFVDYLLRFARRLRGAARVQLSELAAPYLPAVVERARRGDPERRARAVETLALLGYYNHAQLIVEALRDPSPLVAMVAARGIARQQDPRHIRSVVAGLGRLTNWSPRHLSYTLASIGTLAVPALRAALVDPARPPATRAIVADALGRLQDPRAADLAAELLPHTAERELSAALLRLLEAAGAPRHGHAAYALLNSPDPVIRAQAVSALATISGTTDPECFRPGLEDASTWVAIHAARALRDLGHRGLLRDMIGASHPRAALARQVLTEAV